MPTSNNPPNWSKDRTPHTDNPVFHTFILFGPFVAHPFFFLSQLHTHLAKPPTSISYLSSYNPLCISISLLSLLSLNPVCMCCDICGVFLVYPSESKELLFLFFFSPTSLNTNLLFFAMYRQTVSSFAPPF